MIQAISTCCFSMADPKHVSPCIYEVDKVNINQGTVICWSGIRGVEGLNTHAQKVDMHILPEGGA